MMFKDAICLLLACSRISYNFSSKLTKIQEKYLELDTRESGDPALIAF